MKTRTLAAGGALLAAALCAGQAFGWASANRFGGGTMHGWGGTEHTNAFGGSTSHAPGSKPASHVPSAGPMSRVVRPRSARIAPLAAATVSSSRWAPRRPA